jgi:hypothetical protein
VSRDRRRPRHGRGKVVPLFPDTGIVPGRAIRFTEEQLTLLGEALSDAAWARRRYPDPQGQNDIQAAAYEHLARYCGLDLDDDGEDLS